MIVFRHVVEEEEAGQNSYMLQVDIGDGDTTTLNKNQRKEKRRGSSTVDKVCDDFRLCTPYSLDESVRVSGNERHEAETS